MGRGSSGSSGGGGGGGGAKVNTPSGITYDQFMQMTDDQKYDTMNAILNDASIQVPDYLDGSDTTKFIYAIGMDSKPDVVTDAQLDSMTGREIFRTVYESGVMPPPSTGDVLDQIKTGDYTQMSGKGGSAHGRALYFATNFYDSASYGYGERNAQIIRGKLKSTANIRGESSLRNQIVSDTLWQSKRVASSYSSRADNMALYAIAHGIDGWYSGSYTMMVNRGAITFSSQNKTIRSGKSYANDWQSANNAK